MGKIYLVSNQHSTSTPTAKVQDVFDYFENKPFIQFDTETEGLDPYKDALLTSQFGDYDKQFVVDNTTISLKEFKPLLEDSDKQILIHNASFDLRFTYHQDIWVKNVCDTFLMALLSRLGLQKAPRNKVYEQYENPEKLQLLSLYDLCMHHLGIKLDKKTRSLIKKQGLTRKVIKYAAEDVKYLKMIYDAEHKSLKEAKYPMASDDPQDINTLLGLENRHIKALAYMEYKGINIDIDKWKNVNKQIDKQYSKIVNQLDNIIIEEGLTKFVNKQYSLFNNGTRNITINYSSDVQVNNLLESLDIYLKSTGDEILQKHKNKHRIIPKIREYRGIDKLRSSFGKNLIKQQNPKTGRLHPDYWPCVQTGRISVRNPNLNNIPRKGEFGPKIRSCFTAPEGRKIVGGDYGQAELRILAHFSKEQEWIKIFNDPTRDLHSELCARTFNISEKDVKNPFPHNKDITYRDVQKTINYGIPYGVSSMSLAEQTGISKNHAEKVLDNFYKKVPRVALQLEKFAQYGLANGMITTAPPYRRRRRFPQFEEFKSILEELEYYTNSNISRYTWSRYYTIRGSIERASKNTPIQGTNADMMKLAIVYMFEEFTEKGYDFFPILSIYDEAQTECKESFAIESKHLVEQAMLKAGEKIVSSIPMEADCSIENYWKK